MISIWLNIILATTIFWGNPTLKDHPIYLSSTEVAYKPKTKSLEISVKVFSDDFENILSEIYKEKIEIGTDREHPKVQEYIMAYLNKNLKFTADQKRLEYRFVGREPGEKSDMFAYYIYLEVKNTAPFKTLYIENSMFVEEFTNQLNFISCHTKSKGLIKVVCRKGDLKQKVIW
jgi:hypothetical protein